MSQFVETPTRSDTAAGAIGQHLRVKTPGALAVAGASDVSYGTMEFAATAAGPATVRLRNAQGTRKMVAAGAFVAPVVVYAAAGGKVDDSGTVIEGLALESAGADGDVVEVLPLGRDTLDAGTVTESGTQTLTNKTLTAPVVNNANVKGGNVAKVLRMSVTTAQVNAGHELLAAVSGWKYRIHDMALIAIGGNASGATSVDILGTQASSGVKLMAGLVAGLTQNTLLRAGAATNGVILVGGASYADNDANTAITIGKTGSDLATATAVHVHLVYEMIAA